MEFPMTTPNRPKGFDEAAWIEEQIDRYGPVVGGESLRSFLGFRTAAAFQKARLQGQVGVAVFGLPGRQGVRSEEHTSELQSLMRISYAVFCLKKKKT